MSAGAASGSGMGMAGFRVVVTGGLGFIGTHLCRALAARGCEVLAIDRRAGRLDDVLAAGGVRLVRADVSADPLEPLLADTDAVIHLAALPGPRARHAAGELWRHNVRATRRVAAAVAPGCRLVLASTSSVYGEARLPASEDAPTRPLNPYAVTKLAAEGAALPALKRGAAVVICRLFTVFGPGQRPDMAFARWIEAIAADLPVPWCAPPGARREFTYVDDAVRGLLAALAHGAPGRVYNIAGSGPTPVRAALAEIEAALGRRARLAVRPRLPEAVSTAACGRRALVELGYAPSIGLRGGIERQVEAALARPALAPAQEPAIAAA